MNKSIPQKLTISKSYSSKHCRDVKPWEKALDIKHIHPESEVAPQHLCTFDTESISLLFSRASVNWSIVYVLQHYGEWVVNSQPFVEEVQGNVM